MPSAPLHLLHRAFTLDASERRLLRDGHDGFGWRRKRSISYRHSCDAGPLVTKDQLIVAVQGDVNPRAGRPAPPRFD